MTLTQTGGVAVARPSDGGGVGDDLKKAVGGAVLLDSGRGGTAAGGG